MCSSKYYCCPPRPSVTQRRSILEYSGSPLLFLVVGFAAGLIGTLVGAGGGFLVVPFLMHLWPDKAPMQVTASSLLVVFFNGLSATSTQLLKEKALKGAKHLHLHNPVSFIDFRKGLWLATAALFGSLGGVNLFRGTSEAMFSRFFGLLLMSMGTYLAFKAWQKKTFAPTLSQELNPLPKRGSLIFKAALAPIVGFSLSFGTAALASGLGIGGGVFFVPLLMMLYGYPPHQATATSQLMMTVMSAAAIVTHIYHDVYKGLPWVPLALLVGGAIFGAQAGVRMAPKIKGSVLTTALLLLMISIGLRLFLKSFSL